MMAAVNENSRLLDSILPKPPKENLNTEFVLQEIIEHISRLESDFPDVDIFRLKRHLWDIRNRNVDPKVHIRGFLQVFEKTSVFNVALEKLEPSMQGQIKAFIDGKSEEEIMAIGGSTREFHLPPSPAVKHHLSQLAEAVHDVSHPLSHNHSVNGINGHTNGVINGVNGHSSEMTSSDNGVTRGLTDRVVKRMKVHESTVEHPKIFEDEDETKIMEVHNEVQFHNWGQSVHNTPKWSFVPTTVLGLQNLVKWAKINKFRVRCSGYRHSWSSTFSEDNQILVSLLNIESVSKIPDPMSISPEHTDPENELKTIQLVELQGVPSGQGKALARVGVSVTNEQFRRWAVQNDKWTLPVDVILVEVTIGGVNGPICHGAGSRHKTVNDYVRAVEYVDCNGVHRSISDPALLKAAAGHFGLLGIVTHITFELDPMSYALLKPSKPDICLAIPPLDPQKDIPVALRKSYTDEQYAAALADFQSRASNDYYAEWFWFTRSQQAWVNTWNTTDDKTGAVDYPGPFGTWFQWIEGWLGGVIMANPIFDALPGRWQAAILSTMGMVVLPPFEFAHFKQDALEEKTIKCALPNALHFRRGIQNSVVRDMEFQIPIPGLAADPSRPDYSIVQRAWWDIINLCYADDSCPMRLTLELRIMGASELLMAPQAGNAPHGTASIEVLSIPDAVADDEWAPFLQKVADRWLSYTDAAGRELNVRPHWAKEWEGIQMRGLPSRQYLKERAYRDAIPLFRSVLADIGQQQGWALKDLKQRFSNELWDYMIYD